jgi:tetratricopeptide (TPR) repeat protein
MRKYILCILILVLIATIGCATTAVEKTKKAYLDRGDSYYRSGKYQQAIKDYNQAIRLDPKFAEAYNNRGNAYYYVGEYYSAWEDVHKAQSLGYQVHPEFLKALREAYPPPKQEIGRDGNFVASDNGVVKDAKTDLEWIAGPNMITTWSEAKKWVESLNVAGGGWRMPTIKELKTLYKKGTGYRNMTPLLKTYPWWIWSGETKGSSSAWYFNFENGYENWTTRDYSYNKRGFAVRLRR